MPKNTSNFASILKAKADAKAFPVAEPLPPSVTKIKSVKESMTDRRTAPQIYRPQTFGFGTNILLHRYSITIDGANPAF